MKLKHYPAEKLKKEILSILRKHVDLAGFRVFFFGSRIDGTGGERSDIDIGIEGSKSVPIEAMSAIKEDVDRIPVLYRIDVVDFSGTSDDFREVALKHVEPIISPQT